jgi:AcrR family transcriptional regulator
MKKSDSLAVGDRRTLRTRKAIQSAFNALVLTREFDSIRIPDILSAADVARSTFYQHFNSKDDLLCAVMAPILQPLARAGCEAEPSQHLLHVAKHIWENRRLGRAIFVGSTRAAIVRHLAREIEPLLQQVSPATSLPIAYIASVLAQWEIASLEEWLSGRHRCDARSWALALCHGTRGLTRALTGIPHQ